MMSMPKEPLSTVSITCERFFQVFMTSEVIARDRSE